MQKLLDIWLSVRSIISISANKELQPSQRDFYYGIIIDGTSEIHWIWICLLLRLDEVKINILTRPNNTEIMRLSSHQFSKSL